MKSERRYSMTNDLNLESEFSELGFDYKILLSTAKFINDWTIVLTSQHVFKYIENKPERLFLTFTLLKLGNDQDFSIYHIQAFLFTWLVNSTKTRLVISKEYWDKPLPTKDQICNDIDLLRPINAASENPWNYESHLCKFWLLDYFTDDCYLN